MAGIGKWAEDIRRKLSEWVQSIEDQLTPQPEPELVPVRVPGRQHGGRGNGNPSHDGYDPRH